MLYKCDFNQNRNHHLKANSEAICRDVKKVHKLKFNSSKILLYTMESALESRLSNRPPICGDEVL